MTSPPPASRRSAPTGLIRDLPLAPHTTLRLGGSARWAAEGASFEAIRAALTWANARGLALLPLGGGSNVVCADAGFEGLVLRLTLAGSVVSSQEPRLAQLATLDPSQHPPHLALLRREHGHGQTSDARHEHGQTSDERHGHGQTGDARHERRQTSDARHEREQTSDERHGHGQTGDARHQPVRAGVPTPIWVTVGAGVEWDAFVRACCERGWAGLECLSGIPGTVGATPIQNVGAYGQEVSETLFAVTCVDRRSARTRVFSAAECAFGYRTSRFKTRDRERYIVAAVTFRLLAGGAPKLAYAELLRRFEALGAEPPSLMRVREVVRQARASKSMLLDPNDPNTRNCGSFFLNPVVPQRTLEALRQRLGVAVPSYPTTDPERVKIPAAWLIERAGFTKGMRQGNVGLSSNHALCLVAHAGATTSELLAFARRVRDAVREQLDVELSPEPVLVGARW